MYFTIIFIDSILLNNFHYVSQKCQFKISFSFRIHKNNFWCFAKEPYMSFVSFLG